ncbi:hypothetical protein QBC43DRAFT_223120 [Cladorrhinum sp. PSN259]|nr:hypothetical protein QBC43DRAFT_223120 [Cladorrhinum sp. PSN259]
MSQSPSPSSSSNNGQRTTSGTNQRRVSTPKVRTGCITCKSRHVKCDERKPLCFRCEKAGMPCAGYATNLEPRMSKKAAKSAEQLRSGPRPLQMIRPAVSPSAGHVEKDIIYYELLRYSFVNDLAGYFNADFWSRILLSDSTGMQEGCVQHAILAIGALSKAMFFGYTSQSRQPADSLASPLSPQIPVLNSHHRAAIHHQNQAISLCLQQTRESQDGLPARTLLTLTLLLVAYQFLQGDMTAAGGLMTSGIRLLQDSLTMLRDRAARLEEDTEYILPLLSAMGCGHTDTWSPFAVPFSSPTPDINTLEIHFPVVGQASTLESMNLWETFHGRCISFITRAMQPTFGQTTTTPASVMQQEQARLLALLRQWQPIIVSYTATPQPHDGMRTHKAVRLINLQYYTDLIYLSWCLDTTETACDALETEFRQILHITDEFLCDISSPTTSYTYSGGSIGGSLLLVATKCWSRQLRVKALQSLRRMSLRDGVLGEWEAKTIVCCLGLVLLEEGRREERGMVEGENRWLWTGVYNTTEAGRKVVVAEYTRMPVVPDERGQVVRRWLLLDLERWMITGNEESDEILVDLGVLEVRNGELDCDMPLTSGTGGCWDGLMVCDGMECSVMN